MERFDALTRRGASSRRCSSDRWQIALLISRRMIQPTGDHQLVSTGNLRASGGCQRPKRMGGCTLLRATAQSIVMFWLKLQIDRKHKRADPIATAHRPPL